MSVLIDSTTPCEVDYSTVHVVNAWRTERLEFIKIDENNEAIKAFLPQVEQDPVVLALASSQVLGPRGEEDIKAHLKAWSKTLLGVAICLREDVGNAPNQDDDGKTKPAFQKNTIVGTMCLRGGSTNVQTAQHRTAQMGITFGKQYQGKGYGREAINWMVDWAFRHAGLHTVSLAAASYNPRGIHLYQSIGFRLQGRKKETIYFDRAWYDELDFGMTEWEWEELRGLASSKPV
ncbi:hypothetical protein E4U19_005441 [Claviceps sp. Clav32 group G5]|nr:hypothetical protein E4U40_000957 [Claviceps sp. LM458 group G5]KAG6034853.1 hypothetical protein E4U19_005441 [Claviceps sp. Clav32 group G5]KAG6046499.1 hypothetical protein E4U39_001298 [Claviceps sp. Clav50 group G5]